MGNFNPIPGPYRVERDEDGGNLPIRIMGRDSVGKFSVALVNSTYAPSQAEDTARMLSASPELYAAGRAMVDFCDKNPPSGDSLYFVRMMRRALAKVEGVRWCDSMDRAAAQCGCPDCGRSLIDYAGE